MRADGREHATGYVLRIRAADSPCNVARFDGGAAWQFTIGDRELCHQRVDGAGDVAEQEVGNRSAGHVARVIRNAIRLIEQHLAIARHEQCGGTTTAPEQRIGERGGDR